MFVPTIYHPYSDAVDLATANQSREAKTKGEKYKQAVLDKRGEIKSTIEAMARIGYAIGPNYHLGTFAFGDKAASRR